MKKKIGKGMNVTGKCIKENNGNPKRGQSKHYKENDRESKYWELRKGKRLTIKNNNV